jgi:iron complex transport system ATP-binding protein
MIEALGITVQAGSATLLHAVNARVFAGEVLAIAGPNGAGKSTLLRVLSGDLAPQSGHVIFGGRPMALWSLRRLARRRAVVTQSSSLRSPYTVREVVALGRAPFASSPADARIVEAAMREADIAEFAGRSYTTLSGGERQRVHLARALAQIATASEDGARALLLDEPTASLDLAHQHVVAEVTRRLAAEGAAVVIVLHDLNLAAQCADRMLLLRAGRVVACGTPAEVLTATQVRAAFEVPVAILAHPRGTAPLVVPLASHALKETRP